MRPPRHEPMRLGPVGHDLVCGKWIAPGAGIPMVAFGPERFFFCSNECRERFVAMPVVYLRRAWSGERADRLPSEQFVP